MPEAEVIAILGEPTSKAMTDTPGLYWCYGSDSWKQWELGDEYCGTTALQMSRDGNVVELPQWSGRELHYCMTDPKFLLAEIPSSK